jgi:phosphohistidine phosphatase
MRRLILFRHGKAEARAVGGGGDIDRPLAKRGCADSAIMGRVLAREGLAPDLALVSSALRTRQTWDCACAAFPGARLTVLASLYDASPAAVMAEVEAAGENAGTVVVVGHNPGLHELAVNLVLQGGGGASDVARLAAKFPTASAAAFIADEAGRLVFDGLFLIRDHGGEGG